MDISLIVSFAVGLIVLFLLGKLIALPFKLLWKFITNSLVGAVMLWFVNLFGVGLDITIWKALIAGIFGLPGVIAILAAHYLL